jgi:hypothetical protein
MEVERGQFAGVHPHPVLLREPVPDGLVDLGPGDQQEGVAGGGAPAVVALDDLSPQRDAAEDRTPGGDGGPDITRGVEPAGAVGRRRRMTDSASRGQR